MEAMKASEYRYLCDKIIRAGYSSEIEWAKNIEPCKSCLKFAWEAIWTIICSGMKAQVARIIERRVYNAIYDVLPVYSAFKHKGKAAAIEYIWGNREGLFKEYYKAEDKLEYLKTLPWIGDITKYHLAKNLGLDVIKPDRHLVRIAAQYNTTPLEMCQKLSRETGHKLALIDTVIWRAANLGFI